jgi:hypothetical protein
MVEIGKERRSAEVAGQRAGAASSWNTLEGGVRESFRRLGKLENQVTSSASSFVITEGRPIVRQLTRKCCRDLERITASSRVEAFF